MHFAGLAICHVVRIEPCACSARLGVVQRCMHRGVSHRHRDIYVFIDSVAHVVCCHAPAEKEWAIAIHDRCTRSALLKSSIDSRHDRVLGPLDIGLQFWIVHRPVFALRLGIDGSCAIAVIGIGVLVQAPIVPAAAIVTASHIENHVRHRNRHREFRGCGAACCHRDIHGRSGHNYTVPHSLPCN